MDIIRVALTAFCSATALFLITKLMGRKQVSQLDFFDYITGITIGSIAAEFATELEQPIKPLIAMVVYGLLAAALGILTCKAPRTRRFLNGSPTVIMNDRMLYRENMKKMRLDLSEFMMLCRQAGYFNLNDIQTAVFEYNGRLSILPVSAKRPATPYDMGLHPEAEHIMVELIMDGRVLGGNLRRMGVDNEWLKDRLREQGYDDPRAVFLAVCDDQKEVYIFDAKQ